MTASSDASAIDASEAAAPGTMRAIVQEAYGSSDVFRMADVEKPDIAADEVLVQVHAAGLDRGTWHVMTGKPYLMRVMGFGLRRPRNPIPGLDVAGVVVAIGSDVTRFHPGDEVFGIARGSFADHAAAKEAKLAHKPTNLTFEQAAVVPISGSTALQAVRDVGRVRAGHRVLITGASGGVGSYAVQLATAFGAHVTGVSSTGKIDLVRSLGADDVVDYTQQDVTDISERYDVILDIAGNTRLSRLRRMLTPTGTLVIVGGEQGGAVTGGFGRSLRAPLLSVFVGQRLAMLTSKEHHRYLDDLRPMIEAGTVTPAVDQTVPLAEVPAAMRRLEAGHVRGKIVIAVATTPA